MSAEFLVGFTACGCFVIALFFARFWRSTGDRFFAFMAAAFGLFAVNRVVLGFLEEESEARPGVYLVRLIAFGLIIVAIVDKDRSPA